MKRVTVNADLSKFWRGKRRVGRPRFSWLETTMEKAYLWRRKKKNLTKKSFSMRNKQHRKEVARAAASRAFPFDKKKAHKWKKSRKKCQQQQRAGAEAGAHPEPEPRPRTEPQPPHQRQQRSTNADVNRRWHVLKLNTANWWRILDLAPTTDDNKIRSAYRHKTLLVHPDKPQGSTEAFRAVQEAAEKLLAAVRDLVARYPEIVQTFG